MNEAAPRSAIPPVWARATAVALIMLGGALGGVLGYVIVRALCSGRCGFSLGIGVLVGSVVVAMGLAVVAVLALRAMGEWRHAS